MLHATYLQPRQSREKNLEPSFRFFRFLGYVIGKPTAIRDFAFSGTRETKESAKFSKASRSFSKQRNVGSGDFAEIARVTAVYHYTISDLMSEASFRTHLACTGKR